MRCLVAIVVLCVLLPTVGHAQTAKPFVPKPGDWVLLVGEQPKSGPGWLLQDPSVLPAFLAAEAKIRDPNRKSGAGIDRARMAEAEKIRAYESPTRVKVLEMRNNLLKVAVVQGKHFGQVGWALKDRIQIDPNAPKTPELARQEELKERAKSERAKSIKKRK